MGETALTDQALMPQSRIDPQRLAWGVLLIAFAVFCLICVVTGILVYYFLFQSTLPMDALMITSRGTIDVDGQAVRGSQTLLYDDTLSTDFQSQATISLRDPQQDERLIAAITVRRETTATLRRALRPRFDWATIPYTVDLQNFSGDLDIFVPDNQGRPLRLTILTNQGNLIDVGASGQYSVSTSNSLTQVINRGGQVVLIPAGSSSGRDIPINAQGVIYAESPTEVSISPAYVNLLENSTFQDAIEVVNDNGQVQQVARGWACSNTQNDLPRGDYRLEVKDGRQVLRLVRGDNATAHGETRCVVFFSPAGQGLDVSGYTYLNLRASFSISYQSLSMCGTDGSECPMMLRMDYLDQNGNVQIWYHGFYYYLEPTLTYPLTCNSCQQEHDNLYEKAWYTYDSGNLLNLLGLDRRPRSILNVQFYASGHQYDVYVGEVSMLAGQSAENGAVTASAGG